MFESYFGGSIAALSLISLGAIVLLATLVIWSIVWKGFALWFSAKENKRGWFIAILLINTAGILEIIYIFGFSSYGKNLREKMSQNKNKEEKSEDENINKADCECATCEGCDCDCHKPLGAN